MFASGLGCVYRVLGVMAGFGHEVWTEDRWRVLYAAGIVDGLRALKILLPHVGMLVGADFYGRNGNGAGRTSGGRR